MPTLSYATSYLTSVKRCSKGEGTAGLFGHFGLYAVNNRQMLTASVEYTDKQHYGCTKLPQSGTQGSNGSSHPWHSVCVYIQQSFTSTAVKIIPNTRAATDSDQEAVHAIFSLSDRNKKCSQTSCSLHMTSQMLKLN